jgi:glucosamine-6-phosphate deaminase
VQCSYTALDDSHLEFRIVSCILIWLHSILAAGGGVSLKGTGFSPYVNGPNRGAAWPAQNKGNAFLPMDTIKLRVDGLHVEIHSNSESCGQGAARAAAETLSQLSREQDTMGVVFATGASQLKMLRALVSHREIPWERILGFHLDEYVGIDVNHPASFRKYLREHLTALVAMRAFFEVDGNAHDLDHFCRDYAQRLGQSDPRLCLLGIGENGHLAFNEPSEADFHDSRDVKVVRLDSACRQQQVAEGWFRTADEVPERAITLTIPAVFRIPRLVVCVPGKRKAHIVQRALQDPIAEACPATILRTHPNATLFLDTDSAGQLDLKQMTASAR